MNYASFITPATINQKSALCNVKAWATKRGSYARLSFFGQELDISSAWLPMAGRWGKAEVGGCGVGLVAATVAVFVAGCLAAGGCSYAMSPGSASSRCLIFS